MCPSFPALPQPPMTDEPTTVNHNGLHTNTGQQSQVAKDGSTQLGMGHGGSAVLDHDATTGEALDVRQSFAEHRHPEGVIAVLGGLGHGLGLSRWKQNKIQPLLVQCPQFRTHPLGKETPEPLLPLLPAFEGDGSQKKAKP